jgi:hypothetical protein
MFFTRNHHQRTPVANLTLSELSREVDDRGEQLRARAELLTGENERLIAEARQAAVVRRELAEAVRTLSAELAASRSEYRDTRAAFDTVWTNYLTDLANPA